MDREKETILEVKDVTKIFRKGFFYRPVRVLHGVSFSLYKGEILGYLGPNGAGKTTTIKICLGLINPSSGHVRSLGSVPGVREVQRRIGYLPEDLRPYPEITPMRFLKYCGETHGIYGKRLYKRIDELLEWLEFLHVKNRPIKTFSKGMSQRVGLAQALLHEPDLLFLDEPMSDLDPIGRKMVRDFLLHLKSKGVSIIFSTHILSDVEVLCDRIVIINRGRVLLKERLDAIDITGEKDLEYLFMKLVSEQAE